MEEEINQDEERLYSDPGIWEISIDSDDNPDGSDGGYGSHGNYVIPEAMQHIIHLRKMSYSIDELKAMRE